MVTRKTTVSFHTSEWTPATVHGSRKIHRWRTHTWERTA